MTDDKKGGKRHRNPVSTDQGSELEYFARRNGVTIEEARGLIGQFGNDRDGLLGKQDRKVWPTAST